MTLVYPADHWIHVWSWINVGGLIIALVTMVWLILYSRYRARTSLSARLACAVCCVMAVPFTLARLVPGFALTLDEARFFSIAAYLPFAGYFLLAVAVIMQLRARVRYVCPKCSSSVEPTWESCPRCGAPLVEIRNPRKDVQIPGGGDAEPEIRTVNVPQHSDGQIKGQAYLQPLRGPGPIEVCQLGPFTKIGRARDGNHYSLEGDELVSREHLSILLSNNTFVVQDKGSANGTLVNGSSITQHELRNGDEIQLGGTVFRFVWESPE